MRSTKVISPMAHCLRKLPGPLTATAPVSPCFAHSDYIYSLVSRSLPEIGGHIYQAIGDTLETHAPHWLHMEGLVQKRRKSIATVLELRLSCTNPSMSWTMLHPEIGNPLMTHTHHFHKEYTRPRNCLHIDYNMVGMVVARVISTMHEKVHRFARCTAKIQSFTYVTITIVKLSLTWISLIILIAR